MNLLIDTLSKVQEALAATIASPSYVELHINANGHWMTVRIQQQGDAMDSTVVIDEGKPTFHQVVSGCTRSPSLLVITTIMNAMRLHVEVVKKDAAPDGDEDIDRGNYG